jgi:hypothetical protein
MSDELFSTEAVAMLSPRLAWIKKHGVRLHHSPSEYPDSTWCAWFPDNEEIEGIPEREDLCGYGMTEDEAICALATIYDMRLWNEEAGK